MKDNTILNDSELEVLQSFVRELKVRSFGRQVDFILNQLMEKYNDPPVDGEIKALYYGYLFPETVTYLRNMGLRTNTTVIPESETPRNVIYIDPTVVLSEEEIRESLHQSKMASIEKNNYDEEDDFCWEEDDEDDLEEDTEYKPFWRRFVDWLMSAFIHNEDEDDLEEDEEFDEDDFEEDDPEECDYLDEDYL